MMIASASPIGITPAHAGKSGNYSTGAASGKDHPRTCGEKASDTHTDCKASGSPPHMRGKVPASVVRSAVSGITPAHAGKSLLRLQACQASWDHPRTCGEKFRDENLEAPLMGSPPHMRGKEAGQVQASEHSRITPAHAGKSHQLLTTINEGEGSPPHMRGKGVVHVLAQISEGITPAHAGKSVAGWSQAGEDQDHPRTCGEKSPVCWHCRDGMGSPPHMRGKARPS